MQRKSIFVSAALIALATLSSIPAGAQTWNLAWSDEFNGSGAVSGSNWTYDVGGGGWGNAELECYQSGSANANQAGGVLTIQARQESACGMAYSSARLKTQGIRNFGPGDATPVKIEGRIAAPNGQGFWPAFWMLGSDITTVPWPGCGEIDIMEHINSVPTVYGTIHWADATGAHASYQPMAAPMSSFTSYHVYGITWDANLLTWYLDGVNEGAANIQNNINSTEEFHKSFFIIMNLAVGGSWPGNPDGSTVFPANMNIDYVRYSTAGTATATATATAGPTPTKAPTATATATSSGGGGSCAAAWVSTTAYTGGSVVSRTCGSTTSNYTAAFWTQGNDPCTSSGAAGSGQPWGPPTSCGGTTATATATRTATATATATTGGSTPTATRTATATSRPTATATATATSSSKCAGIATFATCTAYASGAKVVFNNTLYHSIAPIPNNRDCPPNSPFDPSTDNWWVNDGGC
jgi:beta-glucanase (GH16 family)